MVVMASMMELFFGLLLCFKTKNNNIFLLLLYDVLSSNFSPRLLLLLLLRSIQPSAPLLRPKICRILRANETA